MKQSLLTVSGSIVNMLIKTWSRYNLHLSTVRHSCPLTVYQHLSIPNQALSENGHGLSSLFPFNGCFMATPGTHSHPQWFTAWQVVSAASGELVARLSTQIFRNVLYEARRITCEMWQRFFGKDLLLLGALEHEFSIFNRYKNELHGSKWAMASIAMLVYQRVIWWFGTCFITFQILGIS